MPEDDLDEMLRKLGRGLFVTELMGQGVNYVTGDYSRGAAGFWVDCGRIAYPVHEITIAGSLPQMFKHIVAVGADAYTQGSKTTGLGIDRRHESGRYLKSARQSHPSGVVFAVAIHAGKHRAKASHAATLEFCPFVLFHRFPARRPLMERRLFVRGAGLAGVLAAGTAPAIVHAQTTIRWRWRRASRRRWTPCYGVCDDFRASRWAK